MPAQKVGRITGEVTPQAFPAIVWASTPIMTPKKCGRLFAGRTLMQRARQIQGRIDGFLLFFFLVVNAAGNANLTTLIPIRLLKEPLIEPSRFDTENPLGRLGQT